MKKRLKNNKVLILYLFFLFQDFSSKMQEAEFQSSGQNNIKLFIVLSVHKIHLFPQTHHHIIIVM